MANNNQQDVRTRRAAMERTKTGGGKKVSEKRRRKQQQRLERQEQRLAERLERQNAKRSAAKKKKNKTRESESWFTKIKEFFQKKKAPEKTEPKKEDKEFQVILGTKYKRLLKVLSIVSLVLVAIIIINSLVPIGILEYAQNIFASGGSGDGFPVDISPSGTNTLVSVGSDVALLGDSSLTLYKSNGKVLFQRQHGYSNPAVCSCSARVMVYDRGGLNLRVENRAKTLFSMETEGAITTACMADNGFFGVVTRGVNYISDVTVYNADSEQAFAWHSASRQVMDISLSDNGRYLGVLTLQVENGQGVTELLLFDTRKGLTLGEQRFEGSTPVSVDMKGNVAVAVLNDRIVSLNKSAQWLEYPFEGGSVTCYDNRNDYGTVLVLGMYQNSRNNRLLVLDEDLDLLSETEVEREVFGVSAKGNRISLLCEQTVLFYSRGGSAKGEAPLTLDGKYLVCKGNHAIVLGTDTLTEVYR